MIDDAAIQMVHVAAAGENRGRVLVRVTTAAPDRIALEAAFRVARAYQAAMESLFIEDQALLELATHEGISELSLCGRDRRPLSQAACLRQFAYAARTAERRIASLARLAEVPFSARVLRDTALHGLNRSCAESGPWNVVAFADPVQASDRSAVIDLLDHVVGVTGFVMATAGASRAHGSVLGVVEDLERLPQVLRVGQRLAAEANEPFHILLAGQNAATSSRMEDDARIALADRPDIIISSVITHGSPAVLAEALRRHAAGIVIGHAGAALLPRDESWLPLVQALNCPLFITR